MRLTVNTNGGAHSRRARDNRNGIGSSQVEADVKRFHENLRDGGGIQSAFCSRCDAWRGELGLEPTPELYVEHLVEVFRVVRRALKDDGTLWLNLGDSYNNNPSTSEIPRREQGNGSGAYQIPPEKHHAVRRGKANKATPLIQSGIKKKDLIGVPWMVAFALRSDGWHLRSDIIWHKPNPMPESVTDRPTKAHEYIFLLSKSASYFYNAEAIKEPAVTGTDLGLLRGRSFADGKNVAWHAPSIKARQEAGVDSRSAGDGLRNKRSVWTVSTKPFPEAHFATFPEDLIEPCILAGSREGDTVLDPFSGAGTTGVVAIKHGRKYLGCELNPEYVEMSERRLAVAKAMATRARGEWAEIPRPNRPQIQTPLFESGGASTLN